MLELRPHDRSKRFLLQVPQLRQQHGMLIKMDWKKKCLCGVLIGAIGAVEIGHLFCREHAVDPHTHPEMPTIPNWSRPMISIGTAASTIASPILIKPL